MDTTQFFKLFDEDTSKEPDEILSEIDYKKQVLKIQIFIKLISNRKQLTKSLSMLGDSTLHTNLLETDFADTWMFNRAFSYIENFDIELLGILYENYNIDWKLFLKCLFLSLKYFEQNEQYENCVILFNIEKKIRELQEDLEI